MYYLKETLVKLNPSRIDFSFLIFLAILVAALMGRVPLLIGFAFFSILSFFSKDVALALLFLSGLLKVAPPISGLYLDITLLSLLAYCLHRVIGIFKYGVSTRKATFLNSILVIFWLIVMISLFVTNATWAYNVKSGLYIVLLYIPLSLLLINDLDKSRIGKFVEGFKKIVLILSALWVGIGLHNYIFGIVLFQIENPTAFVYHISSFGENYMYFSSFCIFLILHTIICLMRRIGNVGINIALFLLNAFLLINSPARGLTLGLIVSVLILFSPFIRKITVNRMIYLTSFIVLVTLSAFFYLSNHMSLKLSNSLKRISDFDLSGKSITDRIASVQIGYQEWSESAVRILFGTGVDSVAYFSNDPGLYAHNLLLEALFEYGVVGAFFILLYFLTPIYFALKLYFFTLKSDQHQYIWLIAVYFVMISFGMFSGTLGNIRLLWILTGLIYFLWINQSLLLNKPINNEAKSE